MPRFRRLRTPEGTAEILEIGDVSIVDLRCRPGGDGLNAIQVTVSRRSLAVPDAVIERVTANALPPDSPVFETMIQPMLLGMIGRLEELSHTVNIELRTVWISLITMLLVSLDRQPVDAGPEVARRVRALRFIEERLPDPALGPDMVAAALGISRRSLYHAFAGGEGVAATIRRLRLERARKSLLDPTQRTRPIVELARQVGLPSAAHFSRLFRAEFGEAPRDLRSRT
jgi:AraC-like DNA-binding protein